MPSHRARDVTELLLAWNAGESGALARLVPLVYAELRRLAHRHMLGERPGHPLQTTALVHEAYLRLVDGSRIPWQNRADLVALDEALDALAALDPRKARVVELRYFAGLGVEETAEVLHVSPDTVTRDWKMARLWLLRELKRGAAPAARVH